MTGSELAVIGAAGAGRMGRGIALVMAYAGHEVHLVDLKPRSAAEAARLGEAAVATVASELDALRACGVVDEPAASRMLARVRFASGADVDAALEQCDVVFEGVPEVMELKRAALARIEAAMGPDAILASTTSTFSADELATDLLRSERFLNAHWLNPAHLVPLVEVSPHDGTAEAVVARMLDLLTRAGKVPVRCRAAPGYIVPRIQALAMNEAARIVADGVASAEDVDRATRCGFGLRFAILGLVEFIDFGGADILHYASGYLANATGERRYEAPPIIGRMMSSGETGLREGKGFHDYTGRDVDAYRRETAAKFVDLLAHLGLLPAPESARRGAAEEER